MVRQKEGEREKKGRESIDRQAGHGRLRVTGVRLKLKGWRPGNWKKRVTVLPQTRSPHLRLTHLTCSSF